MKKFFTVRRVEIPAIYRVYYIGTCELCTARTSQKLCEDTIEIMQRHYDDNHSEDLPDF